MNDEAREWAASVVRRSAGIRLPLARHYRAKADKHDPEGGALARADKAEARAASLQRQLADCSILRVCDEADRDAARRMAGEQWRRALDAERLLDMASDAFIEGERAGLRGESYEANPYSADADAHPDDEWRELLAMDWLTGHGRGEAVYVERQRAVKAEAALADLQALKGPTGICETCEAESVRRADEYRERAERAEAALEYATTQMGEALAQMGAGAVVAELRAEIGRLRAENERLGEIYRPVCHGAGGSPDSACSVCRWYPCTEDLE